MENPYSLKKASWQIFCKKVKTFAIQNTDFFFFFFVFKERYFACRKEILQIHFNENLLNVFIFRASGHLYTVCLMSLLK